MHFTKIVFIAAFVLISSASQAKQFKALLFTKTAGWHHKSINAGVTAIEKLSQMHHFDVDWHEDPNHFNDNYLASIDVIIFLSTTGDILNKKQQSALQKFVRSGKGFVGIHSAADTEQNWPWFANLVGHKFRIHPVIQTAVITPINIAFPGMSFFKDKQLWTDEWYEFETHRNDKLTYLMTVDESTYDANADWGQLKGNGLGDFHPIAWYQKFEGGRSFYTALGHMAATYSNPQFLNHIYGGIYWAATGKGIH